MARPELSAILKHGRLYGVANLINRGAGIVLLPVYAHVLTPAEFGLYAAIGVLTDLLSVLLGMGLGRALMRLCIEKPARADREAVVGTAMAAFGVLAAVFALSAYPLAALGSRLISGAPDHAALATVAVWALIVTTFVAIALNYVLVRKQSLLYLGVSTLKAGLFIGLNLWFVVALGWGVMGIVLGTLLSAAAVAVVLGLHILRENRPRFSRSVLRELVSFGGPLVPSVLLDTVLASLDRYAVGLVHGAAPLGQYGLGLRLATALQMFMTGPFLQIWGVRQMEALQESPRDRELPHIFFCFTVVLTAAALALSLFAREIVALVADAGYADAARPIPFLAAMQVAVCVRAFAETGLFHEKKTLFLPLIGLASLLLAVPIYWAAARFLGVSGIAAAACLVAAARAGLAAALADRWSPLIRLFPWGGLLAVLCFAALAYAAGLHGTAGLSGPGAAAVKAAALVGFAAAAGATLVMNDRSGAPGPSPASLGDPSGRRIRTNVNAKGKEASWT